MTTYQPSDRRPIASRERAWSRAVAGWLVKRGVSPNAISIAGMIACLFAGGFLAATSVTSGIGQRTLWLAAATLVQLRLAANMLDGMVAVQTGKASPIGELYNEIPDRISDAAALIGLGYAAGGSPTLGYVATALAIFTAYVRAQGKAAGANAEFCGPMAKPHRMFLLTVAALFLALTPASWHFRFGPIDSPDRWGVPAAALAIISIGCIVTAIRRLARIAATLRGKSS
jgi:phosphatidylglycerophosphate synthase